MDELNMMTQRMADMQKQEIFRNLVMQNQARIQQLQQNQDQAGLQELQNELIQQTEAEAAQSASAMTDEQIDAEWQRLENSQMHSEDYETGHKRSYLKIAASFIGLLIVSGIAFAAIHMLNRSQNNTPKVEKSEYISVKDTAIKATDVLPADSVTEAAVEFDNIPLEQMLSEIASYYKAEVSFQNENARKLRFYFVWQRRQGLEQVVEDLNHFESLHLTQKDNQIIVE
jgi:ferric-dicitrate binding protein FerR (iron transport regulator)